MASDEARRTQATYDEVASEFLRKTRDPRRSLPWIRRFAARVPAGACVADLGAGPGRDTAQLRAAGLRAFSLDRSRGMLRAGRAEFPAARVQGDLLALPLRSASVEGAWANASLLHLSAAELPLALAEIRRVVVPAGFVHLTLKHGSGSGWENARYGRPRWFQYWTEPALDEQLERFGFQTREAELQRTRSATWIVRLCELSRDR